MFPKPKWINISLSRFSMLAATGCDIFNEVDKVGKIMRAW
jgi:hypothetical protein